MSRFEFLPGYQLIRVMLISGVILLIGLSSQAFGQKLGAPIRDPQLLTQKRVKNWQGIQQKNIVMQQRDYSCGAAVLATIMNYYWEDNITETKLIYDLEKMLTQEELKERMENGLAMTDLRRLAVKNGYNSTIGRLSFRKLTQAKVPLIVGIVHDGYDHFVIYKGYDGEWVYLADPSRGNIRIPVSTFIREWQKNMVLLVAKKGAKPRPSSPLDVTREDIDKGKTNWQVIRTMPSTIVNRPISAGP